MLSEDQFGTDETATPAPGPASWSETSEKLGVRTMEPSRRLEAFDKWQSDTGNYLLEKGELETPEAILDWKTFEFRQKRKLADDFMLEPDEQGVSRDLSAWEQIVNDEPAPTPDPILIRKPEQYRKALLESKAPFDLKLVSASKRGEREGEHAEARRRELAQIISPHAADITDALQRSQEMFGIDFRNVSDDLEIQKGEDGQWTIPSSDNITSFGDRVSAMMPLGSPTRLSLSELGKFQEKWRLSDDEIKRDYLEAFAVAAPATVERTFMPDKSDLESLDSRLKGLVRVVNRDTGNPAIIVKDQNLYFDKEKYDAAVDAADAPDEVKQQTKAVREVFAREQAPEIFNFLQNNREDFAADYAPMANAEGVKGPEARQKMVEAVSKYYRDKEGQGLLTDVAEMAGQTGSRLTEGAMRAVSLPVSILGMMGNAKASRAMGDLSRGFRNDATADQMVAARGAIPNVTKIAGDVAGVLPDLAIQTGMTLATGGMSLAAGASRIAKAAGVDAATARSALSVAMRSGGDLAATKAALVTAKMAPELAEAAVSAAKFVTSKDLLKGASGRQLLAQAGYAGLSQAGSTYADTFARFVDSGMSEEEAMSKARTHAAVAGGITALITGKFSASGRGGVEKVQDFKPGQYTVRDIVSSGIWKQMADPEARKILHSTVKTLAKDVGDEAMEEGLDQVFQGIAAYATDPTAESQNKTLDQIFDEAGYAGLVGGIAGGGSSLVQQVAGKTAGELTSDQILSLEKVRAALRALPESARKAAMDTQETGAMNRPMAPVAEEVTAEEVAQSLSRATEQDAAEAAVSIAPVAPQTAAALAQIAGTELPPQPSGELPPELGAGAATEPPEASLQVTAPAVEESFQQATEPDLSGDSTEMSTSLTATDEQTGLSGEPDIISPATTNEESQTAAIETPGLETGGPVGEPGNVETAPMPAAPAEVPVPSGVEAPQKTGSFASLIAAKVPIPATRVERTASDTVKRQMTKAGYSLNETSNQWEVPDLETKSPGSEVVPTAGESLGDSGDRYRVAPGLQTAATDVGQPDNAKKTTLQNKVKSPSALGKSPVGLAPELQTTFDELDSLTGDFLPAFRRVFSGIEVLPSFPEGKSGGFRYDVANNLLGISLADVRNNLGRVKNQKKWVAAAVAEEVIHAVVHKLERQGKIDSRVLLNAIKRDAPKAYRKFRDGYKTTSDYQAAQEFVRMIAQGRIKFKIGEGIVIDGELTEMQYTDSVLRSLKKVLEQIIGFLKDLKRGKLPKELSAELDSAIEQIEDTLRSLVADGTEDAGKRPPEEEFVWTAEEDMLGTQAIGTRFTKLSRRQADGEGGFLDLYNVVGGPADGTTFSVPMDSTEEEVQAAADAKTEQFSRVFSQPVPEGQPRAQEMGVPGLGKERPTESRDKVRIAVRDRIFNSATADPSSIDDYQEAHELARKLTGGEAAFVKELRQQIADHPSIEGLPEQVVSLAAVTYGELLRYAGRLAIEGGADGVADLSFMTTLLNGYSNLSAATVQLISREESKDATVLTQIARVLGSMQEVSEPFGLIMRHYLEVANQGNEQLRKKGWNDQQIQALNEFLTQPKKSKAQDQAIVEAVANTDGIDKVDAKLAAIQKKRKQPESDESTDEKDAETAIEERIELDVDNSMEAKVRKILARHAANDTWTPDRTPAQKSALEELANKHVKAPVVNFAEQAQELGVDAESAADLDRAISSTRNTREEVRRYRIENPDQKAQDRAVASLMAKYGPRSRKVATVKDIMEAMNQNPSLVANPAYRKAVVSMWLELQGIDPSRIDLVKLDTLVATVFADAQAKLLKDFVGKLNDEQKDPKKKIQPTEIQKIAKALKTGMITGAPVEWQTAFTEKFGMRPLTPQETQQVLKYSSIIDSGEYLHQEKIIASGKLAAIIRRASGNPDLAHLIAASYTQSALTGISTQTLQFTQGAMNWMARIYEDITAGALKGKGIAPVINGVRGAFDAYVRSFNAALINDNYREQQYEEIQKLTALRTAWENKVKEFRDAGKLKRARMLPGLMMASQDFFRRLMSSADDAAVSGLKAYVSSVEQQKLMREAGVSQKEINDILEVNRGYLETLSTKEAWKDNRPDYTWSNYKAWAMDAAQKELRDSIQEILAIKYAAKAAKDPKEGKTAQEIREALTEIDKFSTSEAEIDVGVGTARDIGSKWDALQFFGEEVVSFLEQRLRLNPKDRGSNAAIKYLFWRMLLGFIRTPMNVMSRSVYRGPLGLYRLAVTGALIPGKFSEKAAATYARTMGTIRQQAQRRKEALVWTLTMTTLTALVKGLQGDADDPEDDAIRINGQGPEDAQAREAWRAAGHQPNAIELNFGDSKISVPFGRSGLENLKPGLMMLSAMDDMRLNGMSKGEPENLMTYAVAYGKNTLYNANLFGFKNVANWRTDYATGNNKLTKQIAYMASPFMPFSGFIKSIGKIVSPGKSDDKTFRGAIATSTPMFWLGEKAYNLYGQPAYGTPSSTVGKLTGNLMWSVGLPFSVDVGRDQATMDVYKFSMETGFAPSSPSREDTDKRIKRSNPKHEPMTDEQWTKFWRAAGAERLKAMKVFVPRADKMPDRLINRNLDAVNERAFNTGRRALQSR
jgi:hypothetical protein